MKLRNKKTGKVVKVNNFNGYVHLDDDTKIYSSLAELNEEWGVCEESEGYWYVGSDGEVYPTVAELNRFDLDRMANIGNLFETKEEAEQAVEKLKALIRLEDYGFRFKGWSGASGSNNQVVYCDFGKADASLLNLLFGGGE